jgi:hypothetical protein
MSLYVFGSTPRSIFSIWLGRNKMHERGIKNMLDDVKHAKFRKKKV